MSDQTVGTEGFVLENDGGNFQGVFVGEATIVKARSVSNEDIYKNNKPVDVGIEFTLDIGKDFQPLMTVSGNFKIGENGKVSAGSATSVKIALQRLGVKWTKLGPRNEIPEEVLAQCVGKKIVRLQYPVAKGENGKTKYRTFKEFYLATYPNAKLKLVEDYNKSVAAGYTKPLQDDMEFPPHEPESTPASESSVI